MNFDSNTSGDQATNQWANNDVATTAVSKPTSTRSKNEASKEAGEKLAAEMKVFTGVATELRAKRNCELSAAARQKLVFDTATELFGVAPTWTAFYRETIGADGIVRALFSDIEEAHQYECSDEHSKVMEMLTVLRSRDLPENDPHEPQRMITVRMPKSLHDSICAEANDLAVSVNKLCITRLIQKIDTSLIPNSTQKRRGRRPGTAGAGRKLADVSRTEVGSPELMDGGSSYVSVDNV